MKEVSQIDVINGIKDKNKEIFNLEFIEENFEYILRIYSSHIYSSVNIIELLK